MSPSFGNSASGTEIEITPATATFEQHPKSKAPLEKTSGEKEAPPHMVWPAACCSNPERAWPAWYGL